MRPWSEVMVASASDEFIETIAGALQQEGADVVCVETIDGAMDAVEDGFRPGALIVDGVMPLAPDLVSRLRRVPELRDLPVIAASPVRAPGAYPARRFTVVKRNDIEAVIDAVMSSSGS